VAHLLGAERISLSFPAKDVFDDVTVGLDESDRIGMLDQTDRLLRRDRDVVFLDEPTNHLDVSIDD